ncbi:response regulator receiver modulated CheB methylesterase [[Leptolyngbya] sp. PCC 7376]|uniref:chemotaxis protein CheB n=1 Tax=[Leptolyngbya] sp. PCC 7376 TaxID=111781 RepID=UPI00029EDB48|nr:chemotaxis protein CheB [[Leptolyngbya] sp. PCC 7376]AFY37922.1 response regulator receiver modulated CheB methylesterase [[Leptolyngbya] sp. PCC 7376]
MSLTDQFHKSRENFHVVGIGSSAGGLRTLEEFFEHMPNDSGAAFVVVQHLSPDFKSLMKELLERQTQMMVHQVENGMALEPNHVYLISPRNNLTLRDRHLYLVEQDSNLHSSQNFPINEFFHSLAKNCREKAIGVVLSGTGNDGTEGLESIHNQGGMSLVQSPTSAEFDDMPQSAIAKGLVDQVLPTQQLAQVIYDYVSLGKIDITKASLGERHLNVERVQDIITLLQESEDLEISDYKISTLSHLIYRRASLAGSKDLTSYLNFLTISHEEKIFLKNDLQIFRLEDELQQTRKNLQTAIQELEATNKEWQATKEALLASNEKLQNTNEELLSVNAELNTVNAEYQDTIAELTELSGDINNVLRSTYIGVVFLDSELCIRKFTHTATLAINLRETDIHRPLNHITHNLDFQDLTKPLLTVLETEQPLESEVTLRDRPNIHLLMRIHPYITHLGECDGIVLSFVDISELKNIQTRLADSNNFLEFLYRNAPVGLALFDQNLRWLRLNQEVADIDGVSISAHIGKTPREILPAIGDQVEALLTQVIQTGEGLFNVSIHGITPADPHIERDWLANYYPVTFQNGDCGVGVVVTEITDLVQAKKTIQEREGRLKYLQNACPGVIFTCQPTIVYRFNFISQNILDLVGFEGDRFFQDPDMWFNHIATQDQQTVIDSFHRKSPLNHIEHEYRFRCASGKNKWLAANLKLIRDDDGQPLEYVGFLLDISARKAAEADLRKQESLFRLTIDQSDITVFTQDLDLRYTWVYNPTIFKAKDILGRLDSDLYSEAIATQLITHKQKILDSEQGDSLQIAINIDGCQRHFDLRLEPLMDSENRVIGLAGVSYDITAEKEQQKKLAQQNVTLTEISQKTQAANIAKDEFLANMSHEIRTPMTAILGFTELLQEELKDHPDTAEYLQIIYSSADSLLVILNDILDLSKIEAGKLRLKYETFSLPQLFADMEKMFIPKTNQKGLEFSMVVEESTPEFVVFDEVRLRQILFNLISNAIKFTNQGSVQVTASIHNVSSEDSNLKLEIADTGIGIPVSDQERIFEAFTQREGQSTRNYGGTGLGLHITSRLTEMLNGIICLDSEVDRGSKFTLVFSNITFSNTINSGQSKEKSISPIANYLQQLNDLPQIKILCVDDNITNRLLLKSIFDQTKHSFFEAEDGQEGITMALKHKPDVILLDLLMPILNGAEAIARMKKMSELKDIPIIILTAHTGDIPAEVTPHISGFIRKPFKSKSILKILRKIFSSV